MILIIDRKTGEILDEQYPLERAKEEARQFKAQGRDVRIADVGMTEPETREQDNGKQ